MKTSYFANLKKLDTDKYAPISISGRAPDWYTGLEFRKLAPSISIYQEYDAVRKDVSASRTKRHDSVVNYIDRFIEERLSPLDPNAVYGKLLELSAGKEPVILCYEKAGDFCHRRIIAMWLEDQLDIKIPEFSEHQVLSSGFQLIPILHPIDELIKSRFVKFYSGVR